MTPANSESGEPSELTPVQLPELYEALTVLCRAFGVLGDPHGIAVAILDMAEDDPRRIRLGILIARSLELNQDGDYETAYGVDLEILQQLTRLRQ
jgi:hypothetical protein